MSKLPIGPTVPLKRSTRQRNDYTTSGRQLPPRTCERHCFRAKSQKQAAGLDSKPPALSTALFSRPALSNFHTYRHRTYSLPRGTRDQKCAAHARKPKACLITCIPRAVLIAINHFTILASSGPHPPVAKSKTGRLLAFG